MSEQERELIRTSADEADVEAHRHSAKRGEGEAAEGMGERRESDDEPDVEAHRTKHGM